MSSLSKVVLIGRTNVGKSTLFNRLSTQVHAITFDQPGVTRDFIEDTVEWQGVSFSLIDTAGLTLRKTSDPFAQELQKRGIALLDEAAVIILVCDSTVGLLPEDREIAQYVHKSSKKSILVVNKVDAKESIHHKYDFERLGFDQVIFISSQHGLGVGDLLDEIVSALPQRERADGNVGDQEYDERRMIPRVTLIGKPNVGKSSLLNCLINKDRALVADYPGTTREPITEKILFYKEDIQITDTPGIRRKRMVSDPLEKIMVKRSIGSIDRSDIVLLLIDASEGKLSDQELKLAFYTFEQAAALIILFNKDDLTDEINISNLSYDLQEYEFFLKKIPTLSISCKTGKNIGKILPLINKVWQRHTQEFSDDDLTILFKEALCAKPLYRNECLLAVRRVKQIKTQPITLLLIVNEPLWFGPSQLAFFDRIMRKKYDLKGVPIRFVTRKKG